MKFKTLLVSLSTLILSSCFETNGIVQTHDSDVSENVAGTVAVGAGLPGHKLTLYELDLNDKSQRTVVESVELDTLSRFDIDIPGDLNSEVLLAQIVELEASDTVILEAVIFAQDFDKPIKITPYTDLIAKSILNNDSLSDLDSIKQEYDNVASGVVAMLQPISDSLGISLEADSLLFGHFPIESSGHDELIEAVAFNCDELNCSMDFASNSVEQAVAAQGISTEFTIDDTLAEQLNQTASGLNDLKETPPENFDFTASIKEAGPVIMLFSYDGAWGQPGDAWAGYNGKIKLINLSDGPLDVANKSLSMISESLDMKGAWGAGLKKKVLNNGKTKYTFKFHKYSQPLQPDEHRVIGFNGKGSPTEVNDLTRCRYKGESCIIKYDDTLSDYVSGSSFVVDINSEEVVEDGDITDDVNATGTNQGGSPVELVTNETVVDIILEKAGEPWSTGFNGVIKFASPVATSSWSLTFQKPADVSAISMWSHGGGLKDVEGQSFINVTNKSWNGSLSPDVENSIGASITGKSTYGVISNEGCVLTLDGVNYTCQLIVNEEVTSAEELSTINSVGAEVAEIIEDNGTVDNEEDDVATDIAQVDNTTTDIHSAVVKGSGLTQSKTPTTMTFTAPSDFKNKVVAGYLSDWSVYGRGFDVERLLTPEGTFPYNKLVFAFLGICGDKGSLAGTIAAECQAQGKKEFEVVFLDPWADFGVSVSPRQSSKPYVDGKSKGVIEQIQYIKKQVPNINISASIGGWTMSEPFHRMAASQENIQTFVNSLKALQTEYGFTGFDIDWEFPGHGGASGKFTSNDGQYFKDLVCAVKSGLGDNVEVSSAVGATTTFIGHIGEHYKTIYDQGCLDYIYMMNYDYFGAWDTKLGHQTSVMPSTSLSGAAPNDNDMRWSVNAAIQAFEQAGFKRDRLLMGIANYGRGFKSNDLTTNEQGAISGTKASKDPSAGTFENGVMEGYDLWRNVAGDDLQGRGDFALYSDFEAHADAYYNNVTGDYISIDTPRTAYMKAKLADILGLAGTFVWTVEQDDGRIVTAMQDGLGINGAVPADRSAAYTACGIPFKDGDNNLCAQLYNGLNAIASNSGSDKTIAAVIADAVNVPIADPTDTSTSDTSTTDTSTTDTNTDDSNDTYTIYRSELIQHQSDAESGYKTAINDARLMIRTLDNSIVEAVTPLNISNPDNVKRVESIFTQSDWDELFSHAAPEYSYPKFLQAVAKFPALCDTYDDGRDSDAICRKSLVTMFAHFVQETGKNSSFDGETWKQGLYFVREMGWTETALNGYNGNCNNPDDFASQVWPCGKFDSGEYKSYFGRGAKQLSYNYNYGPFSDAIYGDANVLLNSPEKVADTWLNIASAIFFYVYPQPPKPSMLSVIDGSWKPNQADIDAGISSGFGATIHIINGGLECGAGNESHTGPANRISYYQKFADYFSMAIPADEALGCQDMKPFESTGAGAVPIYWEQDWQNAYKCKLVTYQTAYTTFDDDGYENCVKAKYPDVVIVEDVDNPIVNDDSSTDSTDDSSVVNDDSSTDNTDDNSSPPSNPADCTSGYCTAVANIDGKEVSEVISNANASSVIRNNELKF
ncbi:glycosyl hydrolase family 18 protein, partial [Vibrio thalassae]